MSKRETVKLFSLRVHNSTRSCILLKQFDADPMTWSLPTLAIPEDADPLNFLDEILKQVNPGPGFEVISAVSFLDFTQNAGDELSYNSVIYDLRYAGKVSPLLTPHEKSRYLQSKWVQKAVLGTYKPLANYSLAAYIYAAEKEECLR